MKKIIVPRLFSALLLLMLLPVAVGAATPSPEGYLAENAADYQRYQEKNPATSLQGAVLAVNMGLDHPFYEDTSVVKNAHSVGVLVNKYRQLPDGFVPENLTALPGDCATSGAKLQGEAAAAFTALSRDAKKAGYSIIGFSGYRSYNTQRILYNRYYAQDGAYADTYSARPGFSEHQTGLAIDVRDNTRTYTSFGKTPAFVWAKENLHKYGFILRYTAATEYQTGYHDEPWHFRYVGKDLAAEIYRTGYSYEEFCARFSPDGGYGAGMVTLQGATAAFGGGDTYRTFCPINLSAKFSNVLAPLHCKARWLVDGAAVQGYASEDFTLSEGGTSGVNFVPTGAGTVTVSLELTLPDGRAHTWTKTLEPQGEPLTFSGYAGVQTAAIYPGTALEIPITLRSVEGISCNVPVSWYLDGVPVLNGQNPAFALTPEGHSVYRFAAGEDTPPGLHSVTFVCNPQHLAGAETLKLESLIEVLSLQ